MLPVIFRGHDEAGFFAFALGMGPGTSPLAVLPGNQRTVDARYACLVIVKDYVRMSAESRDAGAWHYSRLEPEILADVRAGRAILVFDLSNEGPVYDPDIFGLLYDWIERNHLPPGRCIWLGQNRSMAAAATASVGSRAGLVQFEVYDYFVKRMAWKFSPAGIGDMIGPDPQGYLDLLLNAAHKDKLLLCLNATPRLARALTVAALHHHQLLHRSLVSFPGMSYVKTGVTLSDVLRFLDQHTRLEYLRPWVHAVGRMSPLRVDEFIEQGNGLVEKIDSRVYARTFFSLVTESDFAESGIARVTEKTVKAFCMGHPTLVIGNPNSVKIMCGLGFADWHDIFDRTAESIQSPAGRLEGVFDEVLRQEQHIGSDPQAWLDKAREISVRNHRYAVSGAFLAHYAETIDKPLVARLTARIAG